MLITEKFGNIYSSPVSNKSIDQVQIEWHEARRRVLHKTTRSGISLTLKFLNENPNLTDGDILWQDERLIIAVEIIPVECIVITPDSIIAAAALCYEIGNRHLPLFYENDDLLIPYDVPLFNLLQSLGYRTKLEERKLNHHFRTTVLPNLQVAGTIVCPVK